jgi:menaquinone-dependent protoporphyrinogen IX oxidase
VLGAPAGEDLACATKRGSTQEVAEAVAATLAEQGLDADWR